MKNRVVVGLDIGTTKVCTVVGEVVDGQCNIIGLGTHPSKGLRSGVVVNIENTVQSIKKAIEEAELMAGSHITSVYAGIAGGHIKGISSHGMIAIKNKEIGPNDVKRVIDAASAVAMPMDREVIHIIPQEFILDDQDGIKDPVGMSGVRLEGRVYIVTGAITSAQNIIKCANLAGLDVDDIVLEQLALSEALLFPEEKELGVAIIDIGGETTDLVIFSNGSIKHTAVFSFAGSQITSNISMRFAIPLEEAENIKIRYGCSLTSLVRKDETIEVPSAEGGKSGILSRQTLAEIIETKMEEILTLVHNEIVRSGYGKLLASGIILTGGSAILEGVLEIAEQIFNTPVRRGTPIGIGGLVDVVNSPMHAAGVGLVLYGSRNKVQSRFKVGEGKIFSKLTHRIRINLLPRRSTKKKNTFFGTVSHLIREWIGKFPGREFSEDIFGSPASPQASRFIDNLCFSAFYPEKISPNDIGKIIAYGHLESVAEEVMREAARRFELPSGVKIKVGSEKPLRPVPKESLIKVTPDVPGLVFDKAGDTMSLWEDFQSVEFRFKPKADQAGKVCCGWVHFWLKGLILSDVPVTIFVAEEKVPEIFREALAKANARPYRHVFPSYSHIDAEIVELMAIYAKSFGDEYFQDVRKLRAGQRWNEELGHFIKKADVFQLFWSENAASSEYVRQEWQHALKERRERPNPYFVRPVYWTEKPAFPIPPELQEIHFAQIPYSALKGG
jgi:cell division protein FtsA